MGSPTFWVINAASSRSCAKEAGIFWPVGVGDVLLLMEEIRPSPVEGKVVHPIIYKGFLHTRWLFGISEPSTVVVQFLL